MSGYSGVLRNCGDFSTSKPYVVGEGGRGGGGSMLPCSLVTKKISLVLPCSLVVFFDFGVPCSLKYAFVNGHVPLFPETSSLVVVSYTITSLNAASDSIKVRLAS